MVFNAFPTILRIHQFQYLFIEMLMRCSSLINILIELLNSCQIRSHSNIPQVLDTINTTHHLGKVKADAEILIFHVVTKETVQVFNGMTEIIVQVESFLKYRA